MPKGNIKYLPIPALLIDGILLLNAFLTAAYIVFQGKFPDPLLYYGIFVVWYIVWVFITVHFKLFDIPRIMFIDQIVSRNVRALSLFIVLCAAMLYLFIDVKLSKTFFAITLVLFSVMFVAWHVMLMILFKAYRKAGNNFKTIAIVGFKEPLEHLISHAFSKTENGYKIVAAFGSENVPDNLKSFYKGTEYELTNFLDNQQVDELIIALPSSQSSDADLIGDISSRKC